MGESRTAERASASADPGDPADAGAGTTSNAFIRRSRFRFDAADAAFLNIGVTPHGEYGAAVDGAPLQSGWEWINRFEAGNFTPPAGDGEGATYLCATTGIQVLLSRRGEPRVRAALGDLPDVGRLVPVL